MNGNSTASPLRAWYSSAISEFLQSTTESVLGGLAANADFTILSAQRTAWVEEIRILRSALRDLSGTLFLEFNIPRMGRRIDVVLLTGPVVFVIEFKVGEKNFERAAVDQVWDYALDLKNFHEASHAVPIVPVLVVTEAERTAPITLRADRDQVYRPVLVDTKRLRETLDLVLQTVSGPAVDEREWWRAPYHPSPTIVEAAQALYAQHSVEAISRHDAGARNLRVTSRRIEQLVDEARETGQKIICFITGVPGSGKTLVGLNIATRRRERDQPTHAVFLSGNDPLVAVLREALVRDEVIRRKNRGEKVRKGEVRGSVKAFIQHVRHFRDEALVDERPPIDHVVIFDEAQRAWNLKQTAAFMCKRRKQAGFTHSEPEFLISYLDRHDDWAAVICLVGGGQEINTGEAGIAAWIDAVNKSFPDWHMYISPELTDSEYAAGKALDLVRKRLGTHFDPDLHLAVSMRSFRADNVSAFVKAVLDCDRQLARQSFEKLKDRYPVVLTRDLAFAKQWVRDRARGSERYGLVASSSAQRLKPHAIDIRVKIDPVHWFLNDKQDTRSSYYLEDAATEFQVQGLEVDWACVSWDGDFRFSEDGWRFYEFCGDRWRNVSAAQRQIYLRNAYRVLLTRARQGMVIFVPEGDQRDATRLPAFYNSTFAYLADLGIPLLER